MPFVDGSSLLKSACVFVFFPLAVYFLSLIPSVQDLLIFLGEIIKGRELDAAHWHETIPQNALKFFCAGVFVFSIIFMNQLNRHEKYILLAAGIFSAAVSFITVLFHEPWFDEINAWWLAKNLSIPKLFLYMKYEGHFMPWYLLIMPFAKAGCPLLTQSIISWLIKPVLFGLLIAGILNTHAYAEGFAGIVSLFFFIEDVIIPWKTYTPEQKKNHIHAVAVIFIGLLIACATACQPLLNSFSGEESLIRFNPSGPITFLSGSGIARSLWIPFVLFLSGMSAFIFYKDKKAFCILLCSYLWMILLSIFIWDASAPNRAMMWFTFLLFALWISGQIKASKSSLLIIAAGLFLINPLPNKNDITGNFSSIKAASDYIRANYSTEYEVYELFWYPVRTALFLTDYKVHDYYETTELYESGKLNDIKKAIIITPDDSEYHERIRLEEHLHVPYKYLGVFEGQIWFNVKLYEIEG